MTTTVTPPAAPEQQSKRERTTIYIAVGVAVVVLLIVALLVHRTNANNAEARQKADQLISALRDRGVQTLPTTEQVANVLGTDGGQTCADPAQALAKSSLFAALTNGAGGPGARPVIADSRLVQGQLLIVKIYCPGQLTEFKDMVDNLTFDSTTNQ
ncbi:MAG TPA: hypothetical protein VFL69_08220 [Marmoricola sp.]|nr:hypothetical protein [Marmoricola sp.]